MARIDHYLKFALSQRASDLHFSAGEPARVRVDGDLVAVAEEALSPQDLGGMIYEILSEEEREKFEKNKNLDKSYLAEGVGNFRLNVFLTRLGIAAVLRAIPSKVPTLEELGLPDAVERMTELAKGLVLVTGPTGSGKSTTLAAMINHINHKYPYHILTVEDPVEFVHQGKRSLVNQRELGSSCWSFADALKYALREDPDVILVGEMRDLETISLALTAAETGHLVFGTLHTRGAGNSIDRIIDSFPANQQSMVRTMLAESLVGVISQVLLKRADGTGRVAAYEIMMVNHAVANLIREGKTFQIPSILQTGRREGMILMSSYIKDLVASGVVTEEEAAQFIDEAPGAKAKPSSMKGTPPAAIAKSSVAKTAVFAPKYLDGGAPQAAAAKPPLPAAVKAKPPASAPSKPLVERGGSAALPPIPKPAGAPPALAPARKPESGVTLPPKAPPTVPPPVRPLAGPSTPPLRRELTSVGMEPSRLEKTFVGEVPEEIEGALMEVGVGTEMEGLTPTEDVEIIEVQSGDLDLGDLEQITGTDISVEILDVAENPTAKPKPPPFVTPPFKKTG